MGVSKDTCKLNAIETGLLKNLYIFKGSMISEKKKEDTQGQCERVETQELAMENLNGCGREEQM